MVLWRRRSFGTQCERGDHFAARMMAIAHTARKQGRDILAFQAACCTPRLGGTTAPSLLAARPSYSPAEVAGVLSLSDPPHPGGPAKHGRRPIQLPGACPDRLRDHRHCLAEMGAHCLVGRSSSAAISSRVRRDFAGAVVEWLRVRACLPQPRGGTPRAWGQAQHVTDRNRGPIR